MDLLRDVESIWTAPQSIDLDEIPESDLSDIEDVSL